jgi:hypothetical protein
MNAAGNGNIGKKPNCLSLSAYFLLTAALS